MARKVNPISVRLHLNRSSDPSRFSDYYHGKPMYQDVNPREYFGSIRPPTRETFGFRLGRCIPHHSPKRTFIHLFPPRRPQFFFLRRRGRSKPIDGWWARSLYRRKGWSIGRLDPDPYRYRRSAPPLSRSGPPPRGPLSKYGAGLPIPRILRPIPSCPIPRRRRRSPSSGSHKCYLRVSGWLAPRSLYRARGSGVSSHYIDITNDRETECFNFLLPRIHSRRHSRQTSILSGPTSRRLLQTISAVRPSSNYLVMQYSSQTENRTLYSLNHFALDKRIRFSVESLTAKTRSAGRAGHPPHSPLFREDPLPLPLPFFREGEGVGEGVGYLLLLLDRSLLFLGATLNSISLGSIGRGASPDRERGEPRGSNISQIDAREQLLGKLGRALRNRLGSRLGLVGKDIDLGGLMRRIGMMIGVIPKNRRIPYGYNYYSNEVRKMRSLLSGGTNVNTSIGSVKIESVYQSASPIAQDISFQLRDGTRSFRSIFGRIVRDIPLIMPKGVGGIRICCPGRLKGAEIARTECREYGKTSCNAFRHQIDYAYAKVSTRYGILGVKVWIPFP
uniref:Ribosomal protein S3 n=1 Tax=Taxus cuspidata var. nana TaxID=480382 RepID=I6NHK4_TAXCU|nr:ribosomal protein S3 [Taxus cuspidata var. nana]